MLKDIFKGDDKIQGEMISIITLLPCCLQNMSNPDFHDIILFILRRMSSTYKFRHILGWIPSQYDVTGREEDALSISVI